MELGLQLKKYRTERKWTQKELASIINVSDKTISSWENNRSYPDIAMLVSLSNTFNISLDEFIKGDTAMVKTIDRNLKLRKVYKVWLLLFLFVIVTSILFLSLYQNKNQWVDRVNPLMEMKIGYTTLPKEVTYNNGERYSLIKSEKGERQFPDDYKDMLVIDGPFGEFSTLSFSGGQSPEGQNYAMVQHKGLYVRRISFISWESIPGIIRDKMNKEYVEIPRHEGSVESK